MVPVWPDSWPACHGDYGFGELSSRMFHFLALGAQAVLFGLVVTT